MVLKTRDRLIEVARQLFLLKGIENTTMIDIANASDNGRRTIYTYFKSKSDIYNAVVERESETHVSELRKIVALEIPATEKLEKYLRCHFEKIREESFRHDNFTAWISLDFSRSDKIKKAVFEKEIDIIEIIFREGVMSGEFNSGACDRLISIFPALIQAVSRYSIEEDKQNNHSPHLDCDNFIDFILNSIKINR